MERQFVLVVSKFETEVKIKMEKFILARFKSSEQLIF